MWTSIILALGLATAQSGPWPALEPPAAQQMVGTQDAAIIIAIEDYAFLPDVPGAVANGTDWYRWLRARGVPAAHIATLFDPFGASGSPRAVTAAIREEVTQKAALVGPGGRVWVVFIGHGAPDRSGRDGRIVGVEASGSAAGLYGGSLTRTELTELARGGGGEVVLVVDACFSGRSAAGDPLVAGLQPILPTALTRLPATELLAAGGGQFAGPLPGEDRPAFSYLLLGALRGWGDANGDRTVTAAEAHAYTLDALRMMSGTTGHQQEPVLLGQASTVLAERANEGGPNLDSVRLALAGSPAPTRATPPAGSSAPVFGRVDLNLDDKLREKACGESAEATGKDQRSAAVQREALKARRVADEAWAHLSPQLEQCKQLGDAERARCRAAATDWLSKARDLEVELPAGSVTSQTECGPREAVFGSIQQSVSPQSLDSAVRMVADLSTSSVSTARAAPQPAASVFAPAHSWKPSKAEVYSVVPHSKSPRLEALQAPIRQAIQVSPSLFLYMATQPPGLSPTVDLRAVCAAAKAEVANPATKKAGYTLAKKINVVRTTWMGSKSDIHNDLRRAGIRAAYGNRMTGETWTDDQDGGNVFSALNKAAWDSRNVPGRVHSACRNL